jgi:hypothetical protein
MRVVQAVKVGGCHLGVVPVWSRENAMARGANDGWRGESSVLVRSSK